MEQKYTTHMNSLVGREDIYGQIGNQLGIRLPLVKIPILEATAYSLTHMQMYQTDYELPEDPFFLNKLHPLLRETIRSQLKENMECEKKAAYEFLWQTNGITENTSLDRLLDLESRYAPYQTRPDANLQLTKRHLAVSYLIACAQGEWIHAEGYNNVQSTFFTKEQMGFDVSTFLQEERRAISNNRNTPLPTLKETCDKIKEGLYEKVMNLIVDNHKRGNIFHQKNLQKAWDRATLPPGCRGSSVSYRGQWMEPKWKKRQMKLRVCISGDLYTMFPDDVEPPHFV